jgi:hypothetical protein
MNTAKLRGIARAAPDFIAMLLGLAGLALAATGLLWRTTPGAVRIAGQKIPAVAGIGPANVLAIGGLVITLVALGALYR